MDKKQIVMATIVALGIYGLGIAPSIADDGGSDSNATVYIQDAPLVQKTLPVQMFAYGTVKPNVNETLNVVLPRTGYLSALEIQDGQIVKKGQKLFEFSTDPSVTLQYDQAKSSVHFAQDDLTRTRELFAAKLATATQLGQAKKNLADAKHALAALNKIGAGRTEQWITAPASGVVTAVNAKLGDRLSQGGSVLQLTEKGAVEVVLGIQPEKLHKIQSGMAVTLTSPFDSKMTIDGKVTAVHGVINPMTRLADAVVDLNSKNAGGLMPGMSVSGVITLSHVTSYVVPRQSVLTDDKGAYVYQVNGKKAVRVNVKILVDEDNVYGISGNLNPKENIVTLGNAELTDGQAIRETNNLGTK
ncbi:MAG: efflux RND transporter periplasmic adaptor subunit [Pseudomonadota bacterium]|nr:efflux RND transporter periplasmic adaptor subunit [Pseudomonadota bacterium]